MEETKERRELRESLERLANTVISLKYADETAKQEALQTLRELIKDSYTEEDMPINFRAIVNSKV